MKGCGLAVLCCAVTVLGAGFGGRGAAHVIVGIDVFPRGGESSEAFTLTCGPTGGTLPFAARVCGDISRHPVAMLHPGPVRSHCRGGPFLQATISTTVDGVTVDSPRELPGCAWPGGARLGLYVAAAQRNEVALRRWERRLRCEEGRFLEPHGPDHYVCAMDGIRLAEQVPEFAELRPERLFPPDTGSRQCTIPTGRPAHRTVQGACSVALARHTGVLIFHERWPDGTAHRNHWWWFSMGGESATLLTEYGAVIPQRWR